MQTTAFKQEIAAYLIKKAKGRGVVLTLSPLKGFTPFKWSFSKATARLQNGKEIELVNVELKVSLFPLLRRHLFIQSLSIEKVSLTSAPIEELDAPFRPVKVTNLPFDFTAKSLRIKTLTFSKDLYFSLLGKVKVSRDFEEILFNLILQEPLPHNSFHLELLSSKKKDLIRGKMFCSIQDSRPLSSFLHLPWHLSTETSLRCDGKWSYWQELKQRKMGDPLCCSFRSHLTPNIRGKSPFLEQTWNLSSEVSLYPNLSFSCDRLTVESPSVRCLGKVSFSASLSPLDGSVVLNFSDLSTLSPSLPFPIGGKLDVKAGLSKEAFLLSFSSDNLLIDSVSFAPVDGKAQASLEEKGWQGEASYCFNNPTIASKGASHFLLTPTSLFLQDIDLSMQNNQISGSGKINKNFSSATGSFFIRAPELRAFRAFFPNSSLEGVVGGTLSFEYEKEDLSLIAHLIAKNVRYQSTLAHTTEIDLELMNLLTNPKGDLLFSCKNLLARGGEIGDLTLSSKPIEEEKQSYSINVQGVYKEPFSLSSTGAFALQKDGYELFSETCQGTVFHQPFHTNSFTLNKTKDAWSLQEYELHLGQGSLKIEGMIGKENSSLKTEASHLPLDVISLFYPSIGLSGSASFTGQLIGTTGHFLATLEEAYLPQMQAKGSLQAHLSSDITQLHMHLYATEEQFVDFTATLPTNYPFGVKPFLDNTRPLYAELTAEGKLHHLFDFLKIANQKIEGWISSHLFLSGNADSPYLQGQTKIEEVLYKNYFTGMHLEHLYADILASGHTLYLQDVHFRDSHEGIAQGNGSLSLNTKEHFPFDVHLDLKQCTALDSPFLQMAATGNLDLQGNSLGCLVKGNLQVDKASFILSEKLPVDIPTLNVTYINKPIHLEQSELLPRAAYPLNLSLQLNADDSVILKGRGLDSIWKGELIVTGTPTKIISKGTLTLDKGEFTFSGKTFTLTHGELSFFERADQAAHLTLAGELKLPSATIIANLQGPLSSPRLTFQSIPQLPTSSILALMLFNKDVSEINTLQTLQLAQVIMSLSGNGGPDVLGAIRKTIGVDRFQISGKEGTDEIALQIGWCIAHGVTVSLSQSASSSDITVEVDLKNGFVFEAESQNQEEGKFSLKWNCNY